MDRASHSAGDPRRILIRGVNWLGDAVMTTPAVDALRRRFPEAHLAMATREKLADLWRSDARLNEVIALKPGQNPWSARRRFRASRCDTALLFPNSPRVALEAWLAGIPRRVGYARLGRNWLLTHTVQPGPETVRMRKRTPAEVRRLISSPSPPPAPAIDPAAHQLHHYLRLAQALGADSTPVAPRVFVSADTLERARALTSGAAPERSGQVYFGLNPGAEYGPAKRWPAERFVAAAAAVQRRVACRWLVFGGEADLELANQISAGIEAVAGRASVLNLAGKTSLVELMGLLKLCRVLLTNDTGPMHLAAAVGTPVVALFGSTSPGLTAPGLPGDPRHRLLRAAVPCAPCFLRVCPIDFRCMTTLDESAVADAVADAAAHA